MSTILILHGWGSCAKNWSKAKELLESKGYEVYLPDLPGFGENSPPVTAWNIDNYVEWVNAFCKKNNLSRFFLISHSFGGAVAIKYAIKYPQNIEKLFLVAAAYLRQKTRRGLFLAIISKIFKTLSFLPFYTLSRKAFYKFIVRKSDYPYAAGIMKETYLRVIKEDLSGVVSSIQLPTAIIWGEEDDTTPIKNAYLLNQKIKGSRLIVINNEGHDLERKVPEILVEKIVDFIKL